MTPDSGEMISSYRQVVKQRESKNDRNIDPEIIITYFPVMNHHILIFIIQYSFLYDTEYHYSPDDFFV